MVRKPSHLGSNSQPSPSGTASAALASMGSRGGESGKVTPHRRSSEQTVEGRLAAFPLLQQGGEDAAVSLKVFVKKADAQLLAIEASPLVDGKPDTTRLERVNLLDLHEVSGLLVPRCIEHLFGGADGRLRPQSRCV